MSRKQGMGLFKRLAGLLGFAREDDQQHQQQDDTSPSADTPPQYLPRKGFGVPVQVPVDRAPPPPPLLLPCAASDGGLQGLRWYARLLRIDEDGDIADEFLQEVLPDKSVSMGDDTRSLPRFEVNYSTRPAKVRNQVLLPDCKILHEVEYEGRLEWL